MNPPFDLQRALKLADASAQAYAPPPGATLISNKATDTHALALADGGDLIVAFRGTADLRNWLTDLECAKSEFKIHGLKLKVHAGFLRAWLSIRDEVSALVSSRAPGPASLFLTGHSLGGALAMLAAMDLQGVAACYTFGQPRVGAPAFANAYNAFLRARTFRVVNSDDLVPRLPWLLASYRHAGNEIFFPAPACAARLGLGEAGPLINPSLWRKLPADALALARALATRHPTLLEDHHVRSYINLLSRAPADSPLASTLNFKH